MEKLEIKETNQTPFVSFDGNTGEMILKGRSIPEIADDFWSPVLNWFESFRLNPTDKINFRIDFDYFNMSSSKRILFLLYKLIDLNSLGKDVKVKWYYKQSDVDMYEVGKDYACIVKVPFEFIASEELEAVNCDIRQKI